MTNNRPPSRHPITRVQKHRDQNWTLVPSGPPNGTARPYRKPLHECNIEEKLSRGFNPFLDAGDA